MRTSNFALRLQPSLMEAVRDLAKTEGVSVNQLINIAVTQLIATHPKSRYIELRGKHANIARALEILNRAGANNAPLPGDELPEGWIENHPPRAKKAS